MDTVTRPALLIGRDHPASVLRAEVARTASSHGGLVLVTGEAGIGKTTLVTDAAEEARRRGALVLGASCWDSETAPGYWPWMQVVRALRRSATAEEWASAEQVARGGLGVLLGEASGEDRVGAFELYDAVTSALVAVSQVRPVVVVLDDLHWADAASLRLLEFAAQHAWFERVLLVGTYRDAEVEAAGHALEPLLLALLPRATTVTLTGLEPDEVGALIARTVGERPGEDVVAEVHQRTGGNPFFVEQTARLWHSGGTVTAIAPGVRDAVRRRLSLLPGPVARLLRSACVLGREFHRQVLAACVPAPVAEVDRLLDRAISARLVVARGGGVFGFAHDLVRETLYDALGDDERRERHAAVVHAVDHSPALAERLPPADLARHAYQAGDRVGHDRTVDLLLAAGKQAASRMAFDEALAHYRRGVELATRTDHPMRLQLSLELFSELVHSGDTEEAREVLADVAAYARDLSEPEALARVAVTAHRAEGWSADSRAAADLLRQAHAALLRDTHSADLPTHELAAELTLRIAQRARRGGDDEALGFSLWTLHDSIFGPGTAAERMALTDELITVARRSGDTEAEQYATSLQWVALLELGDPRYRDRLDRFVALAEAGQRTRMALGALVDQAVIATFTGRFAEAEAFLAQLLADTEHEVHAHLGSMLDHIRWQILYLQGRADELAALHASPRLPQRRHAALLEAITRLRDGDTAPALRLLADRRDHLDGFSRKIRPLALRLLAQAAATTRDAELCRRAREALTPLEGGYLVALFGFDVSGPVTYWLAAIDAAEERWDDAVRRFTEARRSADAMHARPWSVEARVGLAAARVCRGRPGDAVAAAGLLDETERDATALGMRHAATVINRLRATVDGAGSGAAHEFRFADGAWTLTMNGHTVHLPDAKGLRDLHHLLSRPGTDVAAVTLLNPEGGEQVVAAKRLGGDAVLDDVAKTEYKRRIDRLDDQIDQATLRGDDDRAAALDRERTALLHELRAAAGLGGRTRRLGDEAERARKTVTARIRDTLRRLDDRHPQLAAHLRATVSTGTYCRYQPDEAVSWRL